ALPSWEGVMTEDWLGKWAMNQMLINVSTRKFERSMRLPEGDVPAPNGSGLSKSAASRRFVALSAARLKEWMGADLSDPGVLGIQIDGIHMDEDMTLVAAIGVALLHGEFQERSLGFITRIMRFSWRNGRNPDDRPQACDSEPRRRWRLRSVDLQRTLPEVAG